MIEQARGRHDGQVWSFLFEAVREGVPFSENQQREILNHYLESQATEVAADTSRAAPSEFDQRYELACATPGLDPHIQREFEAACRDADIVVNCKLADALVLTSLSEPLFNHWDGLVSGDEDMPAHSPWPNQPGDRQPYHDPFRSGYLSLDSDGLWHLGECTLIVDTTQVGGDCALYPEPARVGVDRGPAVLWANRHKLCMIKHAHELVGAVDPKSFPRILLRQGVPPEADVFIEVHLQQTLNRATLKALRIRAQSLTALDRRLFEEKSQRVGIPWGYV